MKRCNLPIIISSGLNKGFMVRGNELLIVWLKGEGWESCDCFKDDDVEKVQAILRFGSKENVEHMIVMLEQMLALWEDKR